MGLVRELTIAAAIFLVVYFAYHALPVANQMVEGMATRASKTGMCGDNSCPKGCEAPTEVTGNCTRTYKDE